MVHDKQYMLGRYRVVEKIEKVDDGYAVRVTAYDDQAARVLPGSPQEAVRFDAPLTASTMEEAQRALNDLFQTMREEIERHPPPEE